MKFFIFILMKGNETNTYFYILEGVKRTIEVSIPGAEAPESSKCSTVSPTSGIITRRYGDNVNNYFKKN